MEKLDLAAYGVEEMTEVEMMEVDGGFLTWEMIKVLGIHELLKPVPIVREANAFKDPLAALR